MFFEKITANVKIDKFTIYSLLQCFKTETFTQFVMNASDILDWLLCLNDAFFLPKKQVFNAYKRNAYTKMLKFILDSLLHKFLS